MFNPSKRTLLAALAVMAAAAPSTASARFDAGAPSAGPSSGPVPAAATYQAPTSQPSSGGFEWGDAGIGAAATVALMGAGGFALGGRRRREHIARAS